MAKTAPALFLVLPALALTAYWTASNGFGGFVAGVLVAAFLVFGVVGIVKGGPVGAIGAAFLWGMTLVVCYLGMFFIERHLVGAKAFGPGGEYAADKMMNTIGGGLSSTYGFVMSPPAFLKTAALVVCVVGFVVCALARAVAGRR